MTTSADAAPVDAPVDAATLARCDTSRADLALPCVDYARGGDRITWDAPPTAQTTTSADAIRVVLRGSWGHVARVEDAGESLTVVLDLDRAQLAAMSTPTVQPIASTASFRFSLPPGGTAYFDPLRDEPARFVTDPGHSAAVRRLWLGVTCFCGDTIDHDQRIEGLARVYEQAGHRRLHLDLAVFGDASMQSYAPISYRAQTLQAIIELP